VESKISNKFEENPHKASNPHATPQKPAYKSSLACVQYAVNETNRANIQNITPNSISLPSFTCNKVEMCIQLGNILLKRILCALSYHAGDSILYIYMHHPQQT